MGYRASRDCIEKETLVCLINGFESELHMEAWVLETPAEDDLLVTTTNASGWHTRPGSSLTILILLGE